MIHYICGDATEPVVETGKRIIAHIVNDKGAWGNGFVSAISAKWAEPESYYRKQARFAKGFKLGEVQWIFVDTDFAICNMIAQRGLYNLKNPVPLRYDALESCLNKLGKGARAVAGLSDSSSVDCHRLSIHMPRIGCGLARGDWERVEDLIVENLWDIDVYVYDLPRGHLPD